MEPTFEYSLDEMEELIRLIIHGLRTDSYHHKQWNLQEIARVLKIDLSLELGIDFEECAPT